MEREGIDVSVLFPTIGLYIMWRDDIDPELSAAICRAYNTWLADYCDYDRKRLYGVMLIAVAGSSSRGRRTQVRAREIGPGRYLLAAQQILRPDVCQPRLLSDLRDSLRT